MVDSFQPLRKGREQAASSLPADPPGDGPGGADAGGAGLGLAMVEYIARAHGGSVSCESTLGESSTFSWSIPALPLQGEGEA